MALPAGLMIAGTAMQIANGWATNMAKAEQERQNAEFYREQRNFAAISAIRAKALSELDYTTKIGAQKSAYAAGGVDLSGSAEVTVGGTVKAMLDELRAIELKGDIETKLASLRANQSQGLANIYGSAEYNLMQAGVTGITNFIRSQDKPA